MTLCRQCPSGSRTLLPLLIEAWCKYVPWGSNFTLFFFFFFSLSYIAHTYWVVRALMHIQALDILFCI
jgi:hypothetical protein